MACICILRSNITGKKYVGSSRKNDSKKRLLAHNAGKTKSTKSGCPWILIHQEVCNDYTEARKRENFLKSGRGRKWVNENLKIN
ncbi:MAG: hypothetical protein US76_00775 [Parcubacteria group bacterium GW2011_GWA2_38_13b]|nr:MAG: hypothetical protein US76_00775 [Parcubacteria group bacterium GW2011_GWA2_38_13b]